MTTLAGPRPHRTADPSDGTVPSASTVGAGVLEALADTFTGTVAGLFRGGFYVTGPQGEIFAVLGSQHWAGPLHLVVPSLALLPERDDAVTFADDVLVAGGIRLRVDVSRRWAPALPHRLDTPAELWQSIGLQRASGASSATITDPGLPELGAVWDAVTVDVGRGDLAAAFGRLQGRGSGLTPSGDDVLAGIVLVCATEQARRAQLAELARSARTTDLSRAALRWAAAGQSIAPAHALLDAAAARDRKAMAAAARCLAAVGASSGRALAAGIALAATELPPQRS